MLADHAARHGWGRQLQAVTPGALIAATSVQALTQLAFNNVRAVTEILAAAGMLCEDRETALDAWFTRTCSSTGTPPYANPRSATPGSGKPSASPPQAVREDRILDEALATGGDIRRLCDLLGLTVGGAERYTQPAGTGW